MCKKMIFLISLVLVLFLADNAPADTFIWDNGGEGSLWNVPENWDPDGLPTDADDTRINIPDANCIIDSSAAAECSALYVDSNSTLNMTGGSLTMDGFLRIGNAADSNSVMIMSGGVANMGTVNMTNGRLIVGYGGTGTLIMTGGEINVYDKVEIGRDASGVGNVYVYGGTMNFADNSTDLEIGKYGTGAVYQYGGVINVQDNIKLTQNSPDSVARLYLYGGVMTAGNLRNPEEVLGDPLVDITEGMLVLTGDYRDVVNVYIENGWIVPYDGLGLLNVTYTADPNQTTITASNLPPELASHPSPRNITTVSRPPVTLSWEPGMYAASHDVYFGTDPNAVNDANNVPGLWPGFQGNQDPCSFDPGPLELGKTYYWRIDEVNEADPNSPWKGVVWEFTVADYIVIDDFESYDLVEGGTGNMVYSVWSDGYQNDLNGSTIGYTLGDSLQTDEVHGGERSAPLLYNNRSATYSEVTVNLGDLGVGPDLTADNIQTLSLWFYGGSANSAEQLYVKLNGVKVNYDTPINLKTSIWQEWSIDLADFGIDLSNVTDLAIGFDRAGTTGGTGTLLIDDIRLNIAAEEETQ